MTEVLTAKQLKDVFKECQPELVAQHADHLIPVNADKKPSYLWTSINPREHHWSRGVGIALILNYAHNIVILDFDDPENPILNRLLRSDLKDEMVSSTRQGHYHLRLYGPHGLNYSNALGVEIKTWDKQGTNHLCNIYQPDKPFVPTEHPTIQPILEQLRKEIHRAAPKQNTTKELIGEGGRNNHLISQAGRLIKMGIKENPLREILHILNRAQCRPPLPDQEVDKIWHSANTNYTASIKSYQFEDHPPDYTIEPHLKTLFRVHSNTSNQTYYVLTDGIRPPNIQDLNKRYPDIPYEHLSYITIQIRKHINQSTDQQYLSLGIDTAKPQTLDLADGLRLPLEGFTGLIGDTGVGKSWHVLDILDMAIKDGLKPVLISTEGGFAQRTVHYPHVQGKTLYAYQTHLSPATIYRIVEDLQTIHKPNLVVVDPIAALVQGNENDAYMMQTTLSLLSEMWASEKTAGLIVHHTGRENKQRGRGSSAFDAHMSLGLLATEYNGLFTREVATVPRKDRYGLYISKPYSKTIKIENNKIVKVRAEKRAPSSRYDFF